MNEKQEKAFNEFLKIIEKEAKSITFYPSRQTSVKTTPKQEKKAKK